MNLHKAAAQSTHKAPHKAHKHVHTHSPPFRGAVCCVHYVQGSRP